MKKILALAAVAALTAGVSAYAANPFADVSMDHWAYQAVADLSAQGVVEGYPDGSFKGEMNITRYEMAQIVARMMAQEAQMNAQQKAMVEKLAAEYADELSNLGVRVSNIENKLGNVSFTGDARVKMERSFKKKEADKKDYSDAFTGRLRLNVKAQASDKIAVKARLSTELNLETPAATDLKVDVDRLHVEYAPMDGVMLDAGRTNVTLGTGAWYDGAFDGVVASYDMGMFKAQAGYGRARVEAANLGKMKKKADGKLMDNAFAPNLDENSEVWFAQGSAKLHKMVDVGAWYAHAAKKVAANDAEAFWGVTGKVMLTDMISIDGDYVRSVNLVKDADHKARFWDVGANVNYNMFNVGVRYVDVETGSYLGGSALDFPVLKDINVGATFWQATASVALAKDVSLDGYYNFDVKAKKYMDNTTEKADATYKNFGISLNYMF